MKREIIPAQGIAQAILLIRGQKGMLTQDLAELYGVGVKAPNQAVKRQATRFPPDAVKVNIAIMRAFVRLRETLETNRELARKFSELETRVGKHDDEIAVIIGAIRQLMAPSPKPRREIGFHARDKSPRYRTRKHK